MKFHVTSNFTRSRARSSRTSGATCSVHNVLHGWSKEQKISNNRTMFPALKNNLTAVYKGPAKIELSKGAGVVGTFLA